MVLDNTQISFDWSLLSSLKFLLIVTLYKLEEVKIQYIINAWFLETHKITKQ